MYELLPRRQEQTQTEDKLVKQIADVFAREPRDQKEKYIYRTYYENFLKMIERLQEKDQKRLMVKLQKLGIKITGFFAEYGSRFADVVRNIALWPMVFADKNFPKDKNYQWALAHAKAWTEFAQNSQDTATAERYAYKEHWFSSLFTGTETGALLGAVVSGAVVGLEKGAEAGMIAGVQGAGAGAAVGALIGGTCSSCNESKGCYPWSTCSLL